QAGGQRPQAAPIRSGQRLTSRLLLRRRLRPPRRIRWQRRPSQPSARAGLQPTSARWPGWACRPPRPSTTPTKPASSTATSSRPTCLPTPPPPAGGGGGGGGGVRVWAPDSGLAHSKPDPRLTMTGDIVGTLRYMSPEQALAKRVIVDHRTDIYSLGVTLYELLTLRPVFAGEDRQEVLRQIAFDEPRSPRRLVNGMPQELETIIMKAMAKNPADRYATAQELADDLRRFLEDRPIRARRPTLLQRLHKWRQRHRAAVTAAALCMLVTLAVLIGSVGWVLGDRAARQREAE